MRCPIGAGLRAAILALSLAASVAYADTTPQTLPYAQNWSDAGLITADDNWSGVPGIVGYRGDDLTASTGVDPQSIVADGSGTPVDVNANQTAPNTFNTGGVAEFAITNPTVALNGSGTADAPHIVIHLNTTGKTGIRVRYTLRDLDGSADNSIQPVAMQYRVGSSGPFTNVPAGYVADATSGPSLATLVTPVDTILPAAADNQPLVQLRIITANAAGNDEWVGVDDISIDASGGVVDAPVSASCPPSFGVVVGVGGSTTVSAMDADDAVVGATISAGAVAGIALPFVASAAVGAPLNGTLTVDASVPVGSYPLTLLFANGDSPAQTATCSLTINVSAPAGATRIHDIQGAGHVSPMNGMTVAGVPGIVTARASNGFYMQDPAPDANPATSEGIFVFTSSAPTANVGDSVLVSGTVTEFRPGNNANNLTVTELTAPTISVLSSGNALPPPVTIGSGGRVPPNQVINDDGTGNVENSGTFDPAMDGIDFYESLEGMRVQINNAIVTGPTNGFGEVWVIGDLGVNAGLRTPRGGVIVQPGDFNPERIQIDDTLVGPMPQVNVGYFAPSVVGIVDYNFNNFEVLVTTLPNFTSGVTAPEVTPLVGEADRLTVASYNVENLDPTDGAAKFDALAAQIVSNLRAPDIVALTEVQDNNGPRNDSVVDASDTLQTLVNAIAAAGGPTYQYRQVNPVDDTNGGEPGGNIRVAYLFNPNRVSFVDRPGGTSTAANAVLNNGGVPELQFSPGLVDPTNPAFNSSRKPLAGEFVFRGRHLFLIANHFNSKGGDQPLFGPSQPPTLSSEVQRNQQATIVANFVSAILAIDPAAKVVVLGDLNDFEFSNPLLILKAAGLAALAETLAAGERYTYVFQGNSQALDHIMASSGLLSELTGYDVVHVNAEFAAQTSDHDPEVAQFYLPRADVTGLFAIQNTGFAYSFRTRQFSNAVRLTNTSASSIAGPLRVVFDNLTPGVTLANAQGTFDGKPYIEIGGVAAGALVTVPATYNNPSRGPINYQIRVYPGPF